MREGVCPPAPAELEDACRATGSQDARVAACGRRRGDAMMRRHLLEKPMRERESGTGISSAGICLAAVGIAAAVLAVAGLVFLGRSLDTTKAAVHYVTVPVQTELAINQADTYTIYQEFPRTDPEPAPQSRADLKIDIRPHGEAQSLLLRPVPSKTCWMLGGRRGASFLEVDIPAPGKYSLEAAFSSGANSEREKMSLVISAELPGKHMLALIVGAVLAVLGVMLGTTVLFIAAARRRRNRRRAESAQ